MITELKFWKAAGIRAFHTIVEVILAMITVSGAHTIVEVNWVVILETALLSGIVSILKSIVVGMPEVQDLEKTL